MTGTTPAAGVPGAGTTPTAVVPPTPAKITSAPDQPINIPPGTDATVAKITVVPLDPTKPVEVKISTKVCVKESSECLHL